MRHSIARSSIVRFLLALSPLAACGDNAAAPGGQLGDGAMALAGDACTVTATSRWTTGVYVARCTVKVNDTLTIDPGVVVKFTAGGSLDVEQGGKLLAKGTVDQPIVFTSAKDDAHGGDSTADGPGAAAKNDWGCQGACGGLNIRGDGSVLEHVQVLYATSGAYLRADAIQVLNSTFAHHGEFGLVLAEQADQGDTTFNDNAFYGNGGFPLRMERPVFLNGGNTFHDPKNQQIRNGKQCIDLATDIDSLTMFGVTELGFLFSGRRIKGELLLPEGVIFKSRGDAIYVDPNGNFANGPTMILTSYADDALGGDCTGDGAGAPKVGDWKGLFIDDGKTSGYALPADYIRYAQNTGSMPVPGLVP